MPRTCDVFFYGTLMDKDVLARVLGHPVLPRRLIPAVLKGYRPVYVLKQTYPTLVEGEGHVEGTVFQACSPTEWQRLCAYESSAYEVATQYVEVSGGCVEARVFMSGNKQRATDKPWDYARWRRLHKRGYMRSV